MESSACPVIITSRIAVKPDHRPEVLTAASRFAEDCLSLCDCLDFKVTADAKDPGVVFLFESWSNGQSFAQAFQLTSMCEFKETLKKVRAKEPEVKRYRVA